ncbi:3-ketodihydrosphingosine reductase gsl-3 [Paramyrothecium foliicola]|nr:3-ketodihydrosphingosine reductase gsl-3 [Paramyrothecium foliicola]
MDWIREQSFWIFVFGLATVSIASAMGLFGKNHMPVDGKTVLITGASEGMGLSVAKQLAAKGANVIIVSRSVSKLNVALEEIKASAKNPSAQRFHYIAADVAAQGFAAPLLAEAVKWNNGKALDIVWCIAGTSKPELFVDMEMSSLHHQMDVNFFGTAEMCHATLREWLAPDAPVEDQAKHLILTSSVAAFYAIPGYAPYAPSKFALRGLAEALSQEVLLYPQNVKVHIVLPGTILSPGHNVEQLTKPEITKVLEASDPEQTPEQVAERSIRGLERGQYSVVVSWLGELMRWLSLGGSFRNNWIIDSLGVGFCQIVFFFVTMDFLGKLKDFKKKHGHPNTYKKNVA